MDEYLNNSQILSNTLNMNSAEHSKLTVVVEGKDDLYVLSSHLDRNLVEVIFWQGKAAVLGEAARDSENSASRRAYLVDVDFDIFFDRNRMPGVFYTENHDLIMDLILLSERPILQSLKVITRSAEGEPLPLEDRRRILRAAINLAGALVPFRLYNEFAGTSLKFVKFPFGKIQDPFNPSEREVAELIVKNSSYSGTVNQLVQDAAPFRIQDVSTIRRLVGDHDFWAALAAVISKYGIKSKGHKQLEDNFLSAVQCTEVKQIAWSRSLERWAASRKGTIFVCPECC